MSLAIALAPKPTRTKHPCKAYSLVGRGGKIGPARWASPVRPKLGPGWAIKFLAQKKPGQIWPGPVWPSPVWPGPARPARIFFALKILFGPTGPVFRAGWAVKILARKNRANFGPAHCWPGPARPIATSISRDHITWTTTNNYHHKPFSYI